MGTTKLTRKEILAEDPVHVGMIRLIELVRSQSKMIAIVAAGAVLLGIGIFWGYQYLDLRDNRIQQDLAKAIDLYHAQTDPTALDDPYGKGAAPLFRNEAAKNQASQKAFATLVASFGSSRQAIIGRYYLGLISLQMGQEKEALQYFEAVRDNTRDRTLAYLAKKVVALHYLDKGNAKGAQDILEGMIKDPQCELPKEDLRIHLSRAYAAMGKRDQAIRVLVEGRAATGTNMLQALLGQELSRLESSSGLSADNLKPAATQP